MLCYHGRLSLYCFLSTSGLVFLLVIFQTYFSSIPDSSSWAALWGPLMYYVLWNLILKFSLSSDDYQIAVRATFLGFIFAISFIEIFVVPKEWKPLGIYGVFLTLFHYSEFLGIAWCNPSTLSEDSFILNHSMEYAIALISSWVEFTIEAYLFPGMKEFYVFWIVGTIICTTGEILRKLAMITASKNFTHLVQFSKRENHELVTSGIYSIMRHPSYAGWFWWSVGTQVILFNPVCLILYPIVSWNFFRDRIYLEEITLIQFFGTDYLEYQKKVKTGLPLIDGFQFEKQKKSN